jgi:hypothetical protein
MIKPLEEVELLVDVRPAFPGSEFSCIGPRFLFRFVSSCYCHALAIGVHLLKALQIGFSNAALVDHFRVLLIMRAVHPPSPAKATVATVKPEV